MSTFTGIRDVDFLILDKLDDESLGRICQTDRYARDVLCADNNFWRRRIISKKTKL